MQDLAPGIIAILKKYAGNSSAYIKSCSSLGELEIDHLDVPMVLLDIEDRFDVQLRAEDIDGSATVGVLVSCLASCLEARALPPAPRVSRPKRSWVSTVAERRY